MLSKLLAQLYEQNLSPASPILVAGCYQLRHRLSVHKATQNLTCGLTMVSNYLVLRTSCAVAPFVGYYCVREAILLGSIRLQKLWEIIVFRLRIHKMVDTARDET